MISNKVKIIYNFTSHSLHLLVASALALAACSADKPGVAQGNRDGHLYMGIGGEVQNLDPHTVTGLIESRVLRALLEGLTIKDMHTLEPRPSAASRWDISDDGLRYTFHLNPQGRWSNGDTVTSADFVYSWKRILSPKLASEYAYNLYPIKGARAYHHGELKDFSQVGARSAGPLTLEVELESPTPFFLHLLDHSSTYPVHRPTIEKFGVIDERDTAWTRPANYVGNGAFTLREWKLYRHIIVAKNPRYRDAETIRLNEIHFLPVDDVNVEERMFRADRLHVSASIPMEKIETYKQERPEALRITPSMGTYYYDLNVSKAPLDDRLVRRALGLAIDRQKLVGILKGGQLPALALTPPGIGGYRPPQGIRHDPERARQLLADAGYPGGKDFPELEILYNTSEGHRKIAVAIQQMWRSELGVSTRLNNQEWKVYLQSRNNGEHQIARAGWIGDYPDPNTFLDLMTSSSGNNHTRWANADYDQLIAAANRTLNQRRRLRLFERAERILMREMPVIPIYTYVNVKLVHPSVRNWHINPMNFHDYRKVYLEEPAGS